MLTHYAIHPGDFRTMGSEAIRREFLLTPIFSDDAITHHYLHYDRLIAGGAKPVSRAIFLETIPSLKAEFFLQRRELGIINVGDAGVVVADGHEYLLRSREALYLGRGTRQVTFHPSSEGQALYYFNSAPAHAAYPSRHVTKADAQANEVGSSETANRRTVNKLIVDGIVTTCQLQMGLTELHAGSVWNTMPPHTHDRRMEVYFYFDLKEGNRVCHFLGQPEETRHIWVNNHEAVISPPWSIHSGAGTGNYSFIWGMAGENLDYSDMDPVKVAELV